MGKRPLITGPQFTTAERQILETAILNYVDEAVRVEHANATSWHHMMGDPAFFTGHRQYLEKLENSLNGSGLGRFVPLPKWDPATTIPPELRGVKMLPAVITSGKGPQIANANPNIPMPANLKNLAQFPTLSALSNDQALAVWHSDVHITVGGAMEPPGISPCAAIFWLWHAFIDDIYYDWENRGAEDEYLAGDWTGDGKDKIAVRRGNQIIYQSNIGDPTGSLISYGNGNTEDEYLVGDWTGDGKDKIAVRRGNQIIYQASIGDAVGTAIKYGNGNAEDEYLVGDWTGDGKDKIAVRRGNQIIYQANIGDAVGTAINYGNGNAEDAYLVGDWTGDGKDKIAVRRGNQITYQAKIDDATGTAINYGNGNLEDQYLVDDWTGDGMDKIAVRRGNQVVYQANIGDAVGTAINYGNG